MTDPYKDNGYESREHYLSCMAEDYGLDLETVIRPAADLLGPDEDFDELLLVLDDLNDYISKDVDK